MELREPVESLGQVSVVQAESLDMCLELAAGLVQFFDFALLLGEAGPALLQV